MRTRALKLDKLEAPIIFWGMIFAIVLFSSLYGFLINKTVWNVVARQKAENSINALGSETGGLESTYIAMKNSIDLDLAHSLGFSATETTKYINRATLGQLSSNTVE